MSPNGDNSIVIFGAGGHARVIADMIRSRGSWTLVGFVAREGNAGLPLIESEETALKITSRGVVGVGENSVRRKIVEQIRRLNPAFQFITVIDPSVQLGSSVVVGAGSVVMPGAVINTGARIGQHCVVNTSAVLDHDVEICDGATISPGAVLGGNVWVGKEAFIGLGARVIQGARVGEGTVVGAGSVVVKDLPNSVLAYGHPCRIIRDWGIDERVF